MQLIIYLMCSVLIVNYQSDWFNNKMQWNGTDGPANGLIVLCK